MPCNALTQADFTQYGVTTFMTPMTAFGGTGCNYQMQYKDGSGANVIVAFKPGCQFATDRTTYKSENDGGAGGGPNIANYQDVPNLGDAAFYYEDSAESTVEVLHGSVALSLTSSVCNQQECMGSQAMPTTIALAKLVVSRF